jgi:hypothetical protein
MNDETVLRMLSDALWNEGHAIVAVCWSVPHDHS